MNFIMKYKIVKFKIFSYVNKLAFFSFFYIIFIVSLFSPNDLNKYKAIRSDLSLNAHDSSNIEFNKIFTNKIYLDLYLHKIIKNKRDYDITQISINKEGKILGYKPTKLKQISYTLEKQIVNSVIKNILFIKEEKSIYWLYITNKY